MPAMIAAHAGETAFEVAAVEELVHDLRDDRARDFMKEFEVSRRTVARDLDFLRDEERAPLAYDDARHGFHLTDETYTLPPVRISRKEAFSFGLARKLLAHYEGTPLHLDMRSVLDKIADSLEGDIKLHPYHLLAYHGNWYVLALNTAKARVETFALSRFRRIAATGHAFTRPADFSPEAYARQAFGIVGGEEAIKVRLLFEPKLAVYITERQWHPSQEFRTRPDGRVQMRLETTGRKELVRWVLSWMPGVKVLAPKSLRDRIAEKLRDGLRAQQ